MTRARTGHQCGGSGACEHLGLRTRPVTGPPGALAPTRVAAADTEPAPAQVAFTDCVATDLLDLSVVMQPEERGAGAQVAPTDAEPEAGAERL